MPTSTTGSSSNSPSRRGTLAELTVIYWRDIPAQVTASSGSRSARAELSDRFEKAIDAAAMAAGLVGADEYLDQWRREKRPCGEDIEQEVEAEVARLEAAHSRDVLLRLTRAGGLAGRNRSFPGRDDALP